jgi:tetratricopeptide (TPR) repeat protein
LNLYSVGVGDFGRAENGLAEAIEICERLGDWQHWGENQASLAQVAYYQGAAKSGFDLWSALHEVATGRGDQLQQAWGLNGRSEGLLRLGNDQDHPYIIEMLRDALKLFDQNVDRISQIGTYGLLATTYLRMEQFDSALEAAAGAMQLARLIGSPTGYYALRGYSGTAMTFLTCWESASWETGQGSETGQGADRASLQKQARCACRALRRYARVFPIGRPSAWLCRGLYQSCTGHPRAAIRYWEKSIAAAQQFGMTYDEAQAHFELGRHQPSGDSLRREHLHRARDLFTQLQATYELGRTESLLEKPTP